MNTVWTANMIQIKLIRWKLHRVNTPLDSYGLKHIKLSLIWMSLVDEGWSGLFHSWTGGSWMMTRNETTGFVKFNPFMISYYAFWPLAKIGRDPRLNRNKVITFGINESTSISGKITAHENKARVFFILNCLICFSLSPLRTEIKCPIKN